MLLEFVVLDITLFIAGLACGSVTWLYRNNKSSAVWDLFSTLTLFLLGGSLVVLVFCLFGKDCFK